MEPVDVATLSAILDGQPSPAALTAPRVASVTTDSRRIGTQSAFFALSGEHTDGHRFAADALKNGAVVAIVAGDRERPPGPTIAVDSPLRALQRLAAWWRTQLTGRVLAITGSNGKTVVKDALLHLLTDHLRCAGTPGSWNSQLGVSLSVLRLEREVELAVIEAGISQPGQMAALEQILRPDLGILTNVGLAHVAAFGERARIADEKLGLFQRIGKDGWLILPDADPVLDVATAALACRLHRYGKPGLPYIRRARGSRDTYHAVVRFPPTAGHSDGQEIDLRLATPSRELVTDIGIAIVAGHLLGLDPGQIARALDGYAPTRTRMQIWRSPTRDVTVLDDSVSADPVSVQAALRSLVNLGDDRGRRIFVFGGMRELGAWDEPEHASIGHYAGAHGIDQLVLLGQPPGAAATEQAYLMAGAGGTVVHCKDVTALRQHLEHHLGAGDVVLFKGPRNTGIDAAARGLIETMSPNRLLVDIGAIAENIRAFRRRVGPQRRIMAMVKALAYGSDLNRIGVELQRLGVDWLGVATATEGELLRRAGVDLPILVTLASPESAPALVAHRLTPALYSPEMVEPLAAAARAKGRTLDVHLKVDTGLGRIGVFPDDLPALARAAVGAGLKVTGLMTHFASADDPAEDDSTRHQIALFDRARHQLHELGIGPTASGPTASGPTASPLIAHAANTAGTIRFPAAHYDMVRIGIGLYGVYPSAAVAAEVRLRMAVSLLSRIVEVRRFPPGARLGYGGSYTVQRDDFRGAVIPLGYHDAVPWAASNRGVALVHGRRAPMVGRVSMDSTILDVSDIEEARVGSDALLYGEHEGHELRPEEAAAESSTIAYELLARIAGVRVQRIYLGD